MIKVSIIIPIKKQHIELDKVIYSVLNQNFQDFELLLILHESNNYNFSDPRIILIKASNKNNISELLNLGIKYARGEFICFLDSNDLLLYDAIKLRLEILQQNINLVACYGLGIDTDMDFQVKYNQNFDYFSNNITLPENKLISVLTGDIAPTVSSLMIRREIAETLHFNSNLEYLYDWEYFIGLFNKYEKNICQTGNPVYISRVKDTLVKQNKKKYFINLIKESMFILDNYFSQNNPEGNKVKFQYKIYKDIFYSYLSTVTEFYPYSYTLRLYLLIMYLKKNNDLENNLLDFCFISLLLNSLIASKKTVSPVAEAG